MEALILAADNNNVLENDPICFTKTIGSVRLIEYHIKMILEEHIKLRSTMFI